MQNNVIYLESYVESTVGLPPELQRILNTIKNLDERSIELSESIRKNVDILLSMPSQAGKSNESAEYVEAKTKIEQEQAVLIQFADEKVQLAHQACNLLELHSLELDRVIDEFEVELAASRERNPLDYADGFISVEPSIPSKKPRTDIWDAALAPETSVPATRKGNMLQKGRSRDVEMKATRKNSAALPTTSVSQASGVLEEVELPALDDTLNSLLPPGMKKSSSSPQVPGKILTATDLTPANISNLKGRMAELYWPDDKSWYVIQIQGVDINGMTSQIMYVTGETEELDLQEIAREGHMSLIDKNYLDE